MTQLGMSARGFHRTAKRLERIERPRLAPDEVARPVTGIGEKGEGYRWRARAHPSDRQASLRHMLPEIGGQVRGPVGKHHYRRGMEEGFGVSAESPGWAVTRVRGEEQAMQTSIWKTPCNTGQASGAG